MLERRTRRSRPNVQRRRRRPTTPLPHLLGPFPGSRRRKTAALVHDRCSALLIFPGPTRGRSLLPEAVEGGRPAADDGWRKSTCSGAPPPVKYRASSVEAQRQLTLAWTTVPPLLATHLASASVLPFWRRMPSLCLGIMTFVASARRVWRSIIARGRRRGSSSGDVRPGPAPARAVLHGRCCAGPRPSRLSLLARGKAEDALAPHATRARLHAELAL